MSQQGKETVIHPNRHECELPEERGGLSRLPPNAPCWQKFIRWFRKSLSPNARLSITRRNYRNVSQINAEARRHARSKYFYIIHPYSYMEVFRETYFLFVFMWRILIIPLIATFKFAHQFAPNEADVQFTELLPIEYPEKTLFFLQIGWMISCFFTGYKEGSGKAFIQLNHWKIVKRYFFTFFFVDLLSLHPPNAKSYYWIYLNLAMVFRAPTIKTFYARFLTDWKIPQEIITCWILMCLSIFFINLLSCLFYSLPMVYNIGHENLWIAETDLHIHKSADIVYIACYCLVGAHFWGIGESDTRAANLMEEFVLTLAMVIGRLWSLFFIASVLRALAITSLSESKYERYLKQLKTFIAHKKLPKEMEQRLIEYYEYTYQRQFFNEKKIFGAMSDRLTQEVNMFRARNLINKVLVFKGFPRNMFEAMVNKCKILVFLNNDYVIKQGDSIDRVYFISSGTLAVFNSDYTELYHLSDGEAVGLRALTTLDRMIFTYTYISIETTEIYTITVKDLREIIFAKPDIMKYFQKKIDERSSLWTKMENVATATGVDLLSELKNRKVLEQPRIRTRFYEK